LDLPHNIHQSEAFKDLSDMLQAKLQYLRHKKNYKAAKATKKLSTSPRLQQAATYDSN
jgi:hypothetical protein